MPKITVAGTPIARPRQRVGVRGGHARLCSLEPGNGLIHGWQQAYGHATCQPKPEFLPHLSVQLQQQAVLAFIVAGGQLVNVHDLDFRQQDDITEP